MFEAKWLAAVLFYAAESAIELAIAFLVVKAALYVAKLRDAGTVSRFLFLPLVIPALFSPVLHLAFPQLERSALIVQIERAFPGFNQTRLYGEFVSPILILVFLLILTYYIACGLAVYLREVRETSRPNAEKQEVLDRLAREFGIRRPSLAISERHPVSAYVLGWFRAVIIVGKEWLSQLSQNELEALLAHELAHYRRGDHWQALISKTCRALMFFNPLAHYVYCELERCREQATDDLAVSVTHDPLALASTLLKFWRTSQSAIAQSGMGFAPQDDALAGRIRRLCDHDDAPPVTDANELYYSLSIALTVALSLI